LDMIKINLKYCLLDKILEFTHIKKHIQTLNKIEPPPKCRVGRSLNHGSKWAPYSFFRLFCKIRTCTPKPGTAPVK
jgi:hypothetical protein